MPTIGEIASALEKWAPKGSAQSYDNVGLQVGKPHTSVTRGLVALDLTPAVVEEARERATELIITHHPLLFQSLDRITSEDFISNLVLQLAEAEIGYYAVHTNLDAAPGGVSFALADQLGVEDPTFLQHMDEQVVKLVTFVPEEQETDLRRVLADAGAGRIGDYEACAFTTSGTGHFRPGENTSPLIGQAGGDIESVDERRIEVEVARWQLSDVLQALRSAHPYDEAAYDVYPVEQPFRQAGLGVVGTLPTEEPLENFLERVSDCLDAPGLRYTGDPGESIRRVAVCGGAGSDLIGAARRAGADAFVTSDLKYHDYFEVLSTEGTVQMAVIDAGHYETEAVTESLLIKWLSKHFDDVEWIRTSVQTSPMKFFTRTTDEE